MPRSDRSGEPDGPRRPQRRDVLRGVGITAGALAVGGAVSACSGTAEQQTDTPGATGGNASIPVSEVPVGGGHIDAEAEVVVTQPTKGTYAAFSAVCTHQGCIVNQILDQRIHCPCHGSQFSITDGAVLQGPAPKPLPRRKVAKVGHTLKVT